MAMETRLNEEGRQSPETGDEPKTPILQLFALATIASLLGIALGLIIDWFPLQGSTQAEEIDTLWDVLIICSVPMFVLVMTVVLYCAVRFRKKPWEPDRDGPPIHGNTRLEVIWTAIPAVMMLALCTYSYILLRDIEEAPANKGSELQVRVVGEQFTWTFYYPPPQPGGEEIASSRLYLPNGRSVRFKVQSKDVIHDFWVPAFRMKIDAVPGIDTAYRVTPKRLGSYPVVCAELCGLGHSVMRQTATVVTPQRFEDWLAEQAAPPVDDDAAGGGGGGGTAGGGEVDGKTLFAQAEPSCGSCHTLADAGTTSSIGPELDETLKDKDEAYIRRAITEPDADLAPGYTAGIMPPNYGQTLDPAEIDALVTYLMETTKG